MVDLDDDRVRTDFLLGALDDRTREQILDRLAEDEAYFESMAALEEELILRWHHGSLSPADRASFAKAYADPSRRARVDEAEVLMRAGRAWGTRPTRARAAFTWKTPQWAAAAAATFLVVGLAAWTYLANRQGPAAPLRVPLSAVAQKAGESKGYDRVEVPPGSPAVVFVITPTVVPDGELTATLEARDRAVEPLQLRPVLEKSAGRTRVTIAVDAADLPDGDYVLTVMADTNPSEPVATQSLRVIHRR